MGSRVLPRYHWWQLCLFYPFAIQVQGATVAVGAAKARTLEAVQAELPPADDGFLAVGAAQSAKTQALPSQLPIAITVVPRALLDDQQALSLADALHNVAGVQANVFGRRGWDDFIIRGQTASNALFLDGLRFGASQPRVAEQLFGAQSVEVYKGPASLLFGQVLPGGLVNIVSKRPERQAFIRADSLLGNFGLRQGSVDFNHALDKAGKLLFRLNALGMNSDDPTRYVYSRDRWIAPAFEFHLSERTQLTLLTSYQQRRYLRQQGLPWQGGSAPNPNGRLNRELFTGEPDQHPYHGHESRAGYLFTHRFANGWRLHQGLRWTDYQISGDLVTNEQWQPGLWVLKRSGNRQDWAGRSWVQDTYLARTFNYGKLRQELTMGVDIFKSWEDRRQRRCKVPPLDLYQPVYRGVSCHGAASRSRGETLAGGVYLRDMLHWGPRWLVLLGLRRDYSRTRASSAASNHPQVEHATTGSAALMYELWPNWRPYLSFASSYFPNTGADVAGRIFKPETGRQWEAGIKAQLWQGALRFEAALYDLRHRNVLQSDPLNDGFSMAVGEQRSRGGELNFSADLPHGLSLNAGYAYTLTKLERGSPNSGLSSGHPPLDNVAKHSGSLWLRYRPRADGRGWSFSGGLRGVGARRAYGYHLGGYLLADAGVAYRLRHWHYALNLKNIFDRGYAAGGLAKAVTMGDPRSVMFDMGIEY